MLIITFTICLYAAFLVFSDVKKLGEHSIRFDYYYTPIVLFFVTLSWVPLYFRWKVLSHSSGIVIPIKNDILIYVAGFALSVTPGKVGELIRTQLLKEKLPLIVAVRKALEGVGHPSSIIELGLVTEGVKMF